MKLLCHFSLLLAFLIFSGYSLYAQKESGTYKVVINHEEQYSIIPHEQGPLRGWKETKIKGNLKDCHQYLREVWTDMRPLSIREEYSREKTQYGVIVKGKTGLHAIWPLDKKLPSYWKSTRMQGSFEECTNYIEEVWTDMRPLSLQDRG